MKKEYKNEDITVVWQPEICTHSGICARGLPAVFKPRERPWVTMQGASTERITQQIDACPSGALSYYKNTNTNSATPTKTQETTVTINENGPLVVSGPVCVETTKGTETIDRKKVAFCRCTASNNLPFCDGSHTNSGFKG